jgi:hypothetical protein
MPTITLPLIPFFLCQNLSAKIGRSIEQQMVNAASSGKLTIMKNVATDAYVPCFVAGLFYDCSES